MRGDKSIVVVDGNADADLQSLLDRFESPGMSFKVEIWPGEWRTAGHSVAISEPERKRLVQLLKIALS